MEGARPVAGHRAAEPGRGLHAGAAQRVEPGVLRRAAKQGRGGVLGAAGALHLPGVCLHHHRRLPLLPDAAARSALARLDDRALPAALAERPCVLQDGAGAFFRQWHDPRHGGQPGSAHPGRHQPVHHLQHFAEHGAAERGGHAGEFCRHFVDAVGRVCLQLQRCQLLHSRLHGLDGGAVLRGRQRHHPLHRPAADQAQFPAAAGRGRLPAPHGAGARIQRIHRAGQGRSGGTRATRHALCRRAGQLPQAHQEAEKPGLVHQLFRPGGGGVSVHRGRAALFQRCHPARRTDPDFVRLWPRAGFAELAGGQLQQPGRLARHDRPADQL